MVKTQIANLINGSKNVIINSEHPKYLNAKKSSSHLGYAGTNCKERSAIADLVHLENPNTLVVKIKDLELILNRTESCSGKTISYSVEIIESQALHILGFEKNPINEYESYFTLSVNHDMTITLRSFARQTENCQWKNRYNYDIDEAFVTIL